MADKDKRAYAKFDIGYLDNPKMLPVLDESPTAVLVHAVSVLYAAQHLTDGHVPYKSMLRKVGGTQDDADLLVREGVWHRPRHDCEECPQPVGMDVYVHNFLEHNRAASEVKKAKTAAKTAADARWGNASDDADRNADRMRTASGSHSGPHADRNADRNAVLPESQCAEREKERETESAARAPSGKGRKKSSTTIPDGWKPTDSHRQKAQEQGVNLDREAEQFRLHAEANDRRCVNWNSAFAMWINKARPDTRPAQTTPSFDPWASDWSEDDYRKD